MFNEPAKIRDVAASIAACLGHRFQVEVKGGAASAYIGSKFVHRFPRLEGIFRNLAMLDVTDLDIQVYGASHRKHTFVKGLQGAAVKLADLLEPEMDSLSTIIKQLGKSTEIHYMNAGKAYHNRACATPIPLQQSSFLCPTLHGDITDSVSGCTCSLARFCIAAANLRSRYVAMLPIIDIVLHPGTDNDNVNGQVASHGVRSAWQLFEDNIRMVFAETGYRPWLSDRPEKVAKRMRRAFGLLLILHPEALLRRAYRRGQCLNNAISKIIIDEQERQYKLQSKLQYLLTGRKSVTNMKPLQTLHEKRARGPLRFLIGNIKACLGNAPHPGTAASANYIEWLECLGSCCFEYEQGLTILCHWSLTSANALTTENIFACIRNRMGHEGHAANVR